MFLLSPPAPSCPFLQVGGRLGAADKHQISPGFLLAEEADRLRSSTSDLKAG